MTWNSDSIAGLSLIELSGFLGSNTATRSKSGIAVSKQYAVTMRQSVG
jgi:hypothetical protein